MTSGESDFWTAPSLLTVLLFAGAWLLATALLLLAATDFFQISLWRRENLLVGILWLFATDTTGRVLYRYFRSEKNRASTEQGS